MKPQLAILHHCSAMKSPVHQLPMLPFGGTNPFHQQNNASFGMKLQSDNIIPPLYPPQQNQNQNKLLGSNFQNVANPSPHFKFRNYDPLNANNLF